MVGAGREAGANLGCTMNTVLTASTRWEVRRLDITPVARTLYTGAKPGTGGHSTSWLADEDRDAAKDAYARAEKFVDHLPGAECVRLLTLDGRSAFTSETAERLRSRLLFALYEAMVPYAVAS